MYMVEEEEGEEEKEEEEDVQVAEEEEQEVEQDPHFFTCPEVQAANLLKIGRSTIGKMGKWN